MIDKKDFITMFEENMNDADFNYVVIAVEGVGSAPELIINQRENFKSKYDYYRENYDNEMRLIHNPKIFIGYVGFYENMLDLTMDIITGMPDDQEGSNNA